MTPKLSIIIPVYNKEKTLIKCLDSITSFTEDCIEIILVDDCSTDNSVQTIQNYKDPRIKLITLPENKGTYYARKTGVQHAIGDYTFFVDPDDYIDSHILKLAIPLFNKFDIIHCPIVLEIENELHSNSFWAPYPQNLYHKDIVDAFYTRKIGVWGSCAKFVKRELIEKSFIVFDVDHRLVFLEDLLTTIASSYYAESYIPIDYPGYYYFINSDSSSSLSSVTQIEKTIENIDDIITMLNKFVIDTNQDLLCLSKIKLEIFTFVNRDKIDNISNISPYEKLSLSRKLVDTLNGFDLLSTALENASSITDTITKIEQDKQNLQQDNDNLQQNKWYRFGQLSRKQKIKKIIIVISKKLKIYPTLKKLYEFVRK